MVQVSLFFFFQTIQLTQRPKFEHDVFYERVSKALPEPDLFNKVLNQCIRLNPIFLDLYYCSHRCVITAISITDLRCDRGFWRCGALILEETFDQGCVIDGGLESLNHYHRDKQSDCHETAGFFDCHRESCDLPLRPCFLVI